MSPHSRTLLTLSGHGLSIDPGAKRLEWNGTAGTCACAYFDRGSLAHVEFNDYPGGAGLDWVVVERMQADSRTRGIDIRYLLLCQFNGARAAAFAAGQAGRNTRVTDVTPSEWKGTEPKPAQHARLWMQLDPSERLILGGDATMAIIESALDKGARTRWGKPGADYYPRGWVVHNILDAVGMGLEHTGRLEKR